MNDLGPVLYRSNSDTHEWFPATAVEADQVPALNRAAGWQKYRQAEEVTLHPERDLFSLIMDFEQGELDDDGTLELFQRLVNSGMAWTLQGSYGRMAVRLIEAGLISE